VKLLGLSAAIAALSAGVGNGVDVLKGMFTPRFHLDEVALPNGRSRGKRYRRAHNASAPARHPSRGSDIGCGAKQCRKYKAQGAGINVHFENRMAWLARNQHVIAKREADQAKAAERGFVWGRRLPLAVSSPALSSLPSLASS
jgi:hypothetical protein